MEQTMNDLISTKIDFLKEMGADKTPHRNKTLLEHLIGVSEILKDMDAPEYIQDAGLFHSVYGTAYFRHQTVSDRQVVQDLIGEKAELLAYLFCVLGRVTDRQSEITAIEDKRVRDDLMLIDFANSEEQSRGREMKLEDAYNV